METVQLARPFDRKQHGDIAFPPSVSRILIRFALNSLLFRRNGIHGGIRPWQIIEYKLVIGRGGGIRRLASVVRHVSEFTVLLSQLAETKLFP